MDTHLYLGSSASIGRYTCKWHLHTTENDNSTHWHQDTDFCVCVSFAASFIAFSAKGTEPKQHQLLIGLEHKIHILQHLKFAKRWPRVLPFCAQQPASVMSQTKLACAAKGKKINWARDGSVVDQWTCDRKVLGSTPGRSSGRIFFSRVNFLCRLFQYLFHPCVTAVACERSRSFCQKCRWLVSAQCTCSMYVALSNVTL